MSSAKPTLGRAGAVEVAIDVERLVDTRLLIQASSGGGKSWAIRRILEQTHGKVQQLVLDVEGEFHTLAERFDYVLAGRKDGDCPAHPRAAPLLAKRLLELGVSAVIDLYELESHERFAFVRAFLKALIDADRALWHPALVVVDEAHVFCPEHGKAESAGAVIDLCTRGRKRGFAAVLATQRLSKLHKDAAAECVNKLVGRCQLDIDMRRAGDELGFVGKSEHLQLRALKPGHFFAFGPAFGVEGVERIEVGPVETKHLRPGERAARAVAPREAVKSVLSQLADIPREAAQEAKDLAEANARSRQLEKELRAAKSAAPPADPKAIENAREAGRAETRKALRAPLGAVLKCRDELERLAKKIFDGCLAFRAGISICTAWLDGAEPRRNGTWQPPAPQNGAAHSAPVRAQDIQDSARRQGIAARAVNDEARVQAGLTGPMQRVLDAMAWLEVAGIPGPFLREQVAFIANYSPSTSSFKNALGALNTGGLASYPKDGFVELTQDGRFLAHRPEAATNADELQRRVLSHLDGPKEKCLRPLLAKYPESMSRDELASAAGYSPTTSSFKNAIGGLRTLGAIDYPLDGEVIALPWLFLEEPRA